MVAIVDFGCGFRGLVALVVDFGCGFRGLVVVVVVFDFDHGFHGFGVCSYGGKVEEEGLW